MNIVEKNWNQILNKMKQEYCSSNIAYNTWVAPLTVYEVKDNTVYILVKLKASLEHIEEKYLLPFKVCIAEITGVEYEVAFVTENTAVIQEKKDIAVKNTRVNAIYEKANLNPKYTFDTFVVGSNNRFAHAASVAVAESPGESYNPLFLYGGVGLGKTHLIQSIGNFVLKNNPSAKVLYTTSESFTNEVIDLLRKKKTNQEEIIEFRKKYRSVDVLLIDDIQFISGRDRTQEEIFNIFNDLFMKHKQIVLTSDKKPKDMEGIAERLISRFEQGLTVDIQNPDYETRMAILKKKAETSGYNIDEGVLQYIANHFVSNVRELEGSLTRVITFSKISHSPITVDFASGVLQELVAPNQENAITCEYIINIVADHFQISPTDICSKKKSREFAYPRQICMYLCRVFTDEKLETIGAALKKTNHATVSYGYDKIKSEIETDSKTRDLIDVLKKKINPN
mgnify:CR=1 FL=1